MRISSLARGFGQAFPISRDPPEGGTWDSLDLGSRGMCRFQFLGIPPKGERCNPGMLVAVNEKKFPISRDPPEGGTRFEFALARFLEFVSNF